MDSTCNEIGQLLVGEDLGVYYAADADGGDEDMYLP